MMKRYLVLMVLAISLLAGCGAGAPTPTPIPFQRHSGQDVIDALNNAGLSVRNVQRDIIVGRDAPSTFSDRYTFEIHSVAPDGGQILVFANPEGLQAWNAYITSLRASSATRRSVVYTYVHNNVLLQLSANLLPDEAAPYEAALAAMG